MIFVFLFRMNVNLGARKVSFVQVCNEMDVIFAWWRSKLIPAASPHWGRLVIMCDVGLVLV
jgi:hypothetical protein